MVAVVELLGGTTEVLPERPKAAPAEPEAASTVVWMVESSDGGGRVVLGSGGTEPEQVQA